MKRIFYQFLCNSLYCTLVLFSLITNAQESSLHFKHLTPNNGLTQSVINNIYTDTKGFVWMTGLNGINRFDGSRCLANNEIASGPLNMGTTKGIVEDKNGDIWIGYVDGLIQYSYHNNRFSLHNLSFLKNEIKNKETNVFSPLQLDKENNLLIGGLVNFLILYNITDKKTQIIEIPVSNSMVLSYYFPANIPSLKKNWKWILVKDEIVFDCILKGIQAGKPVWEIKKVKLEKGITQNSWMPDADNLFYFANSRIWQFNFKTKRKKFTSVLQLSQPLIDFIPDAKGDLWISGINNSLQLLDTSTMRIVRQITYNGNNKTGISSSIVRAYIDCNQMLWVASWGKGVDYADLQEARFTSYLTVEDAKANKYSNFIRGITQGLDSSFFCSTQSGIIKLNKNLQYQGMVVGSNQQIQYPDVLAVGNKLYYVHDLEVSKGLFQYDIITGATKKITFKGHKEVLNIAGYQLHKMADNKILVGSLRGLMVYDSAMKYAEAPAGITDGNRLNEQVNYSYEDEYGQLYKCLQNGGFIMYKKINNEFKEVYSFKDGVVIKHIMSKKSGFVWIATNNGLYLFNNRQLQMEKHFTEREGLPNNIVYAVMPDEKDNLWLSTNKGICYFDEKKNSFTNFTQEDGLQANEFNTHVALLAKDGRIIFGGVSGLTVINPGVLNSNIQMPVLQLTALKTDSVLNPYHYNSDAAVLVLNAGTDAFDAELIAINFSNPILCKIKYRLKGYDNDWQYLTNPGTIRYKKLPAGRYVLEALASNTRGEFGKKIKRLTVIVKSYWWQTIWFKIGVMVFSTLVTIFFIVAYLRYKLKRQKEKMEKQIAIQAERERITADLHDDMGATLSSMYIYSDLASAAWELQPLQSKEMVNKISALSKELMARMGDIVWSLWSPEEEKNSFTLRLKNYSQDFLAGKGIAVNFKVDESLAKQIVNPLARKNILLIAKEAINNIAKYSEATEAIISLQKEEGYLLLNIIDNGNGFRKDNKTGGNGLGNIKQRCIQLGGSFSIESTAEQGTKITCRIPIATISHVG